MNSVLSGKEVIMLAAITDDPWLFVLVILAIVALAVIIVGRWRP